MIGFALSVCVDCSRVH